MPLSSLEISQATQFYQGQYQQQAAYAATLGSGLAHPFGQPQDSQVLGEGMAGRALNRGVAIGAPLATAGLALAGMDPFSLGWKAGGLGMRAGMGFGGGVALGAGVMGGATLGIAAAGYAGNQMMTGAQQAQQFNQNIRGSFMFHNPSSFSGHGFAQNDIREMGSAIRSIAGSGEQGFDELGRLAAQMGRMGMAQGVRNAKEFGEKFREMMTTVKTIAREFNTSLEEAQTLMASMRGSGIFGNQGSVAKQIRGAAVSGGLATTEVTGMMNIGSQISRMFGGTGRQGAMGGIESINQVGTAVQRGILSEEDIYNATGLTGAEGRRALAQQQLEQTGSFLRGAKGRWFLASLAGKNGKLDPSSVANWMGGGMGVGETRNQAHQNLHGVGRANFIRNEGRLRGAVMEQFGGMAPAMAMLQWAQQRGIDINDMDDRSMLFAQRQLGMGRDEADVAVKMARQLPELMQARREAQSDDTQVRDRLERQVNTGVEGIKRRFEKARNRVNNEMQAVGQRVMNSLSDTVADWANRLAGTYEEVGVDGLSNITHAVERGGGGAAGVLGSRFGGYIGKLGTQVGQPSTSASSDFGWMKARDEQLKNLRFSARMGEAGDLEGPLKSFVEKNKGLLMEQYSDRLAGLSGEDRIDAVQKLLSGTDKAAAAQFRKGNQAELLQRMERLTGVRQEARADTMMGAKPKTSFWEDVASIFGRGASVSGKTTAMGQNEELGFQLLGSIRNKNLGEENMYGAAGISVGDVAQDITPDAEIARGAGSYLRTAEGRSRVFGLLGGSEEQRKLANQDLQLMQARVGRGATLTKDEQSRMLVLRTAKIAMDYNKMMTAGSGKISDADWSGLRKRYAEAHGVRLEDVSREDVERGIGQIGAGAKQELNRIMQQESEDLRGRGEEEARGLYAGGLTGSSSGALALSEQTTAQLMKSGGAGAVNLGKLAIAAVSAERSGDREGAQKAFSDLHQAMNQASEKELQAMARGMAGTTTGQMASEFLLQSRRMGGRIRQAQRSGFRGGAAGTAAVVGELGIDLDRDQIMGLGGMDASKAAALLSGRLGVDNKEFTGELAQALTAARGGKSQAAAGLLGKALEDLTPEQRSKLHEMQKGGPDPIDKVVEKIGDGNKFLEQLVKGNQRLLSEVYNLKPTKDGEGGADSK